MLFYFLVQKITKNFPLYILPLGEDVVFSYVKHISLFIQNRLCHIHRSQWYLPGTINVALLLEFHLRSVCVHFLLIMAAVIGHNQIYGMVKCTFIIYKSPFESLQGMYKGMPDQGGLLHPPQLDNKTQNQLAKEKIMQLRLNCFTCFRDFIIRDLHNRHAVHANKRHNQRPRLIFSKFPSWLLSHMKTE